MSARKAKGKRPPNERPELGQVWENLNTGRVARVIALEERFGRAFARLESLSLAHNPSWCSLEVLANSYTWKRKE